VSWLQTPTLAPSAALAGLGLLGVWALASPVHAQDADAAARQTDALRFLATTAGFDTVSTGLQPWASAEPKIPVGHHRSDVVPEGPTPAPPGAPQGADGVGSAEPPPGGEDQVGPRTGSDRVHEAMPEGAQGGPDHAPLEILVGDYQPDRGPAFVLTLIDNDRTLNLRPTVRIGEALFALNDAGVPPDVAAEDGRWAAVIEQYPLDVPVVVMEGVVVRARVPLVLDGDLAMPGLQIRLGDPAAPDQAVVETPEAHPDDAAARQAALAPQQPAPRGGWWPLLLAGAALIGLVGVAARGARGQTRRQRQRRRRRRKA